MCDAIVMLLYPVTVFIIVIGLETYDAYLYNLYFGRVNKATKVKGDSMRAALQAMRELNDKRK